MNDRVVQPRRFTVWMGIGLALPILGTVLSRLLPEPFAVVVATTLCLAGIAAIFVAWKARYRGPG